MLFSDAIDEYLSDKSKRLRATTMDGYRSAIRAHVGPRWGVVPVDEITHEAVQEWVDGFEQPGAAEKAFKTFRQIFRWITRRHSMRLWDVTQGVELPRKPLRRSKTLDARQEREMLRGIFGEPWEAVILLEAACGLRRSEACGVDWSDFDWRRGFVHVQRGAHWSGGHVVELPTKTRLSDRWVKVPRFALERLRRIRGQRKAGRIRGDMAPHQIAGRFKRFCRAHSLPWVPMMSLRHSFATIAIESGAALADVAVTLGHTSVDTCRQHYLLSERMVTKRTSDAWARAVMPS